MTSLFDQVDNELGIKAPKPEPNDREKVRSILQRFPDVSDEFIAKRTGIDKEAVAEHAGILIDGGGP